MGSKGYNVYVGERREKSLAASSKYCYQSVLYPDPASDSKAFCKTIIEIVDKYDIDLVIPVTDICVFPISRMVKEGRLNCNVPIAKDATMRMAADKNALTKFALELGLSVPESQTIESKDSVSIDSYKIPFPIVIKPSRSRVKVDDRWIFTSVKYANNKDELRTILNETVQEIFPVILQERVHGNGVGAFYCYDNGRCIAKFSHRRIREKPPSGGVSVLRESVRIDPLIDKHSQLLLDNLKWHGVAMVEFKHDEVKNIPYLMEINGRFWGSLQLAIDAGVDFPKILVDISQKQEISQVAEYELGVKTRWLWGDIDLLLMLLFKSRYELNLPDDYGPKWKVIASILNPLGTNLKYEVLKLSDISPWLYESKQWIKGLVNKN
ncbi:MAG: ATP-grasp domain-containing protein [Candidatus Thiodiazotropha sp.]